MRHLIRIFYSHKGTTNSISDDCLELDMNLKIGRILLENNTKYRIEQMIE